MALEIKQTPKLVQQLVITPQLQQAIRLLQLTRLELVDMISQEMKDNPLLEEIEEGEQGPGESPGRRGGGRDPLRNSNILPRSKGEGETPEAINEFDWENYLENYNLTPYSAVERSGWRREAFFREFSGEEDDPCGPSSLATSILPFYRGGASRRGLGSSGTSMKTDI